MSRSIIIANSLSAVAVAAFAASLAVALTSGAPKAEAEPVLYGHERGDRLATRVSGTDCSSLGWPNYEQGCQFDRRMPAYAARPVRVIALR